MENTRPRVLSLKEVETEYGISPYRSRKWIKSEQLRAIKAGRKLLVPQKVLEDFLNGDSNQKAN